MPKTVKRTKLQAAIAGAGHRARKNGKIFDVKITAIVGRGAFEAG
jgi:hypothetical protein